MKKSICLILIFSLFLSLSSCGTSQIPTVSTIEIITDQAFEDSKAAYAYINYAYEITTNYASDIYETWRLCIDEQQNVINGGCSYLGSQLNNLSEEEIRNGVAYLVLARNKDVNWDDIPDEEKEKCRQNADSFVKRDSDNFLNFWVNMVTCAYQANGKADEIQKQLDNAKKQMKELTKDHSDYEYYPSLKAYFTSVNSLFDFCQSVSGSLEQAKVTINEYRKEARDYQNDLNFIFED